MNVNVPPIFSQYTTIFMRIIAIGEELLKNIQFKTRIKTRLNLKIQSCFLYTQKQEREGDE